MSTVGERARENVTGLFTLLVLGLGFVALFADFEYFFLIWILGYAVALPIFSILTGEHEDEESQRGHGVPQPSRHHDDRSTTDALATLRGRYARGDLTDEQFERKLDALLETESPEAAAEWRTSAHGRTREPDRDHDTVREPDSERARERERT